MSNEQKAREICELGNLTHDYAINTAKKLDKSLARIQLLDKENKRLRDTINQYESEWIDEHI